MSALGHNHGVPLGGTQVQVDEMLIVPAAFVDVVEGGLVLPHATHHLRIILPAQRRALLIPVDRTFLQRLGRETTDAGANIKRTTTVKKA